jgi:hypothetical protein
MNGVRAKFLAQPATADQLESVNNYCPYCGEPIELLIDCSVHSQEYVEDCQVCCAPMVITTEVDSSGFPSVSVRAEDE